MDRTVNARLTWETLHDAHGGRAALFRRQGELILRKRLAGARPHATERRLERRDRGSANVHHRVAPARLLGDRIAGPFVADAETARHCTAAIHDEQFAVIPAERLHRAGRPERPKRAHVDAVTPQLAPEPAAGAARPKRVVQDTDAHTGARALRPRRREAAAGFVVVNDVVLEMDGALGAADHVEHGVERIAAEREMPDEIAGNRPRARRAIERPRKRVSHQLPRPSDDSTVRSA